VHKILATAALGGLVLLGACNSRQSVIDGTSPSAPSSSVGTASVPASSLVSLLVDPSAVLGGTQATGRILLSFPAPAGGVSVGVSSSNSAAIVPPSVVVPGGSDSATFNIDTQSVSTDVSASIVARNANREAQGTLGVWTRVPPFAASWADSGNGQRTTVGRVTPSGQWRANCYGSEVSIFASESSNSYFLDFAAPDGRPMTPGTYDNAQTGLEPVHSRDRPLLEITTPGYAGCSAPSKSRFVVTEADLVADRLGTVRRFSVTFEQQCGTLSVRGELTVVGVAPGITAGGTCIR
jgi:hypothetical protein